MRAQAHPDYPRESEYLKRTLKQIMQRKEGLSQQIKMREEEISEILAFLADAKKPEDLTQAQLFEMRRREEILNKAQLLTLTEKSPYFGRLDVSTLEYEYFHILNFELKENRQPKGSESRSQEKETLYLGKFGLDKEETGEPLIVDWRAPIADLFYSGNQGKTSFSGPYGPVKVELHLLRRIKIEDSNLLEISDAEEAAGIDDFLLSRLRESSIKGLKEIIATIQKEQNEIIRSSINQPIIVQGAAGSGKTSVALHRLSYLLYKNKKEFHPEDTLIVTPSRLFFNYIAELMPNLDIKRANQLTFSELAQNVLKFKVHLRQNFNCFENLNFGDEEDEEGITAARLKGSIEAIKAIDNYVSFLEKNIIPKTDMLTEDGILLLEAKDLQRYFDDLEHLPINEKIKKAQTWLNKQAKIRIQREKNKIVESFEGPLELARRRHPQHLQHLPNPDAIALLHQRDLKIKILEAKGQNALKDYKTLMPKRLNLKALYSEFLLAGNLQIFWPELNSSERQILEKNHQENKKRTQQEDLALLLRLHQLCLHFETRYNYILVDEAQDLNISEIFMLKEICTNSNALTLVGDLAQAIYPHRGIKDWQSVIDNCFPTERVNYREINQSYRNEGEITKLTNKILLKNNLKPSQNIRPKEVKPILQAFPETNTWSQKAQAALELINSFKTEANVESIALIAKNIKNCKLFLGEFEKQSQSQISFIDQEESQIEGGLVLIPAYLAKGLEFDACIILDGEKTVYKENSYDNNLLYVAMTRARHRLAVFYRDEIALALK